MSILVDTTIWSLALRRSQRRLDKKQRTLVERWRSLVENGDAALIGPIRQEILSGVKSTEQFERLREDLAGIDCIAIRLDDYDCAARFYNQLRSKGVAGSAVDLILCAVAYRTRTSIFTTDRDFDRYARHLPLELHEVVTP